MGGVYSRSRVTLTEQGVAAEFGSATKERTTEANRSENSAKPFQFLQGEVVRSNAIDIPGRVSRDLKHLLPVLENEGSSLEKKNTKPQGELS